MSQFGFSVHGHFYQPSREDPFTGKIPEERGAYPYRNWNELIFQHCYLPNTEIGNFQKISFNFGPTLLDWMNENYPEVLQKIISEDRQNYEIYGVGNALAQPYHHTILPLASKEDKITQIHWGIEDFKNRFGHDPAGMWLPETAVDMETLNILAEFGIQFTILAPWQADTDHLDITQPYWVSLENEKKIAVFFYHRDLSTQISFNPLATINADVFATNLLLPNLLQTGRLEHPKYLLIASDGELYGHHQPFRDKFLAHLLNGSLKNSNIQNIFPGLWLKLHPPIEFIKIHENSSWSCLHGINRWSTGCDCTPFSEWKENLKIFIDYVGNLVNDAYTSKLSNRTSNVWDLRNRFIEVITGKKTEKQLIEEILGEEMADEEVEDLIDLIRAQFERQRMYTSCGWFFEDYDRIEPLNVVAYASQALLLTQKVTKENYFPKIEPYLRKITSHSSGLSALDVYQEFSTRAEFVIKVAS